MSVDWTKSMEQTFEYYTVDPATWEDKDKITTVRSGSIDWDENSDTLVTATLDIDENPGEVYIRKYLVTIQNGVTERHDLGTFLLQTPGGSHDGTVTTYSADLYSPLIELNEKPLPIGYYIPKDTNIMDIAYRLARENMRAPVVKTVCDKTLQKDFVADTNNTYLTFIRDLVSNANFIIRLDEKGRLVFAPKQEIAALQPVYTFNDDNSSILLPDIDWDEDLFGIPNVVNVVYSSGTEYFDVTVKNNDLASPTSIINRGREIPHRVINPEGLSDPTDESRVKEFAEQLLKSLSSVEKTVNYTHGYCGNKIGDCVRLNYRSAGLINVKAKVVNQSIDCTPGCQVTETAVYTKKYWR